ncbi:MAG: hypothetical protein WAW79_08255 [Steroidobacteraceae bacterium]
MTRILLILTALAEAATGVALLAVPSIVTSLLFGVSLESAGTLAVAHVAGAALLAIGFACWLAREEGQTRAGRAVIKALLFYNLTVAAVLAHAGLVLGLTGIGLWPATVAHGTLSAWCIASLRRA